MIGWFWRYLIGRFYLPLPIQCKHQWTEDSDRYLLTCSLCGDKKAIPLSVCRHEWEDTDSENCYMSCKKCGEKRSYKTSCKHDKWIETAPFTLTCEQCGDKKTYKPRCQHKFSQVEEISLVYTGSRQYAGKGYILTCEHCGIKKNFQPDWD